MEAAQEIASILDSQLPSEEKIMLILDSQLPSEVKNVLLDFVLPDPAEEINKFSASSTVDHQDQIQQKEEANTKEDDNAKIQRKEEANTKEDDNVKIQCKEEANAKEDDNVKSKWRDEPSSHSSSQQSKAKESVDPFIIERISSILKSDITWEDKTSVLATILFDKDISQSKANTATSSRVVNQQGKSRDSEEKAAGGHDNLLNDRTSKKNDESLSSHSPEQNAKANVAPGSELKLKEKSIYDGTTKKDISQSKANTATSSREVNQQRKSRDSEEKEMGGHDNLLNDGTSKKINESLSSRSPEQKAKANVASESELKLKEKTTYDSTSKKDISLPEDDTSNVSSKIELDQEINRMMDTKASRQVAPAESSRFVLENEVVFIIKESNDGSDDKEEEITIEKQKAACKYCNVLIFLEARALIAKCGCSTSLIHENCATAWSREKGDKCSYCENVIENTGVLLSLTRPQARRENRGTPSSPSARFCCFF